MSRLTSVDNPILEDEAYTYDAVGNRLTASGVTGNITHTANNELQVSGNEEYVYHDVRPLFGMMSWEKKNQ